MDIITSLVGVVASMISYILVDYGWKFTSRFGKKKHITSYSEKLSQLTSNLTKSSKEVDLIISELSNVASEREGAIKILENNLASLEKKEIDLKHKIETLEKIPVPVAEYFSKLIEPGEKRSAKRDYLLFGAGVFVSTVMAIVLRLLNIT